MQKEENDMSAGGPDTLHPSPAGGSDGNDYDSYSRSGRSGQPRVVMHVDFDYFFAQCEELRRPELKERPVLVCVFSGRTEDSGVVSTANYVARAHGVKSGIPIRVAKSRLAGMPDAVLLPLDAKYYSQVSEKAMAAIASHADRYERVGIDECFIDVSERVLTDYGGDSGRLASEIKSAVRAEAGITCSVGVAPNKMLAKVASDFKKPDGLTVVGEQDAASFLAALEVDRIPGVGPKTRDRLGELGVRTAGDLAAIDPSLLAREFGKKTAAYLHNAARGVDDEPVVESGVQGGEKSQLMRIVTLKQDASTSGEMYGDLVQVCKAVYEKAADKKLAFRTVGVILVLDDLENVTRSKSAKVHSASLDLLQSTARSVLDEAMADIGSRTGSGGRKVRRLGVRLSDLRSSAGQSTMLDYYYYPAASGRTRD